MWQPFWILAFILDLTRILGWPRSLFQKVRFQITESIEKTLTWTCLWWQPFWIWLPPLIYCMFWCSNGNIKCINGFSEPEHVWIEPKLIVVSVIEHEISLRDLIQGPLLAAILNFCMIQLNNWYMKWGNGCPDPKNLCIDPKIIIISLPEQEI